MHQFNACFYSTKTTYPDCHEPFHDKDNTINVLSGDNVILFEMIIIHYHFITKNIPVPGAAISTKAGVLL
jgi:hypothetical protein